MANIQTQISTQLLNSKSLSVSPSWLSNFVSSSTTLQRNIPLSALVHTALFRILSSDFRESLTTGNSASLLPVDIFDPTVQERRLQGPIPVQVLDIDDVGSSLWSQVEAIERIERGEAIRGREIVRTVNVGEDSEEQGANNNNGTTNSGANAASSSSSSSSSGPHRLIFEDAAGTRAVAIELKHVDGIALGKLSIGAKLILRNATVARGMILLTPESVTLLGGKIECMDQSWKESRKTRLLARIADMEREQA